MQRTKILNIAITILAFIIAFVSTRYFPGYDYDKWCWQTWAAYMHAHGLQNTYGSGTNYLPLYQYVLYIYSLVCGSEQNVFNNIALLRLVVFAFDLLGLWYVYLWTKKKISFYLLVLISLVNISYSYNTLVWGQLDGVNATLGFISIYYGYHRKITWSTIFFILALNMKLQAVILLPVWGYFYLQHSLETRDPKTFIFPLLAGFLLQAIILLPFIGNLPQVGMVVAGSVGKYPFVSVMAFNFWHLVLGENVWNLPDSGIFLLSLTYKQWGLLLFMLCSLLVLLPLLNRLYATLKNRPAVLSRQQVWLIPAIVAIAFFFFSTQMHERYSHPAFIFLLAYAVYTKNYFPYILFSSAYFFNLDSTSRLLHLNNYHTFIFAHTTIAWEYAILLAYLFLRLWKYGTAIKNTTPRRE